MQIGYLQWLQKQTQMPNSQSVFLGCTLHASNRPQCSFAMELSCTNLSHAHIGMWWRRRRRRDSWKEWVKRKLDSDSVCSITRSKFAGSRCQYATALFTYVRTFPHFHANSFHKGRTKRRTLRGLDSPSPSDHSFLKLRHLYVCTTMSLIVWGVKKWMFLAEEIPGLPPSRQRHIFVLNEDRLLIFARDNVDVVFCRDFQEQRAVVCRWPLRRPLRLVTEVHVQI